MNSAVRQSAERGARQRQTGSARVGWHHQSPKSCSELRSSWSSRNSHRDRHKDRPCRRRGGHPARGRAKPVPRRHGDAQRPRLYALGRENALVPRPLPGTGKAVATAPRGVPGKPRRGSNGCARVVSLGRFKLAHKERSRPCLSDGFYGSLDGVLAGNDDPRPGATGCLGPRRGCLGHSAETRITFRRRRRSWPRA